MWTLLVLAATIFFISEGLRRHQAPRRLRSKAPLMLAPPPYAPLAVQSPGKAALDTKLSPDRRLQAFLQVLELAPGYEHSLPLAEAVSLEHALFDEEDILRLDVTRVELWMLAERHRFEAGQLSASEFADRLQSLGLGAAGAIAARHWPALAGARAESALLKLLDAHPPAVRAAAIRGLVVLDIKTDKALEVLTQSVNDVSLEVSMEACLALGHLGGGAARAVLEAAAQDQNRPRGLQVSAKVAWTRMGRKDRGQLALAEATGALSEATS